jgi:hypothetical protein
MNLDVETLASLENALGEDAARPHRVTCRKLTRQTARNGHARR